MRIAFAGTPDFAVPPLQALIDSPHEVVGVLTQPDRPAGRGRKLTASPVKELATGHDIPVSQPEKLRTAEQRAELTSWAPDLLIVVAYGLILPRAVLDLPARGCWNIHASLLPRWRGAAPIQHAIISGDEETGVCIMEMEAGLDTGPVLDRCTTAIGEDETAGQLHDRLQELGTRRLMHCLDHIDELIAQPQDEAGITYAGKIVRDDARVDFSLPADELDRLIRAFNPWPGAHGTLHDEPLKIWRASVQPDHGRPPGTVLESDETGIVVACDRGSLRLEEIQRPGKRRMPAALAAQSVPAWNPTA